MSRLYELVPGGSHTYSKGPDRWPLNAPRIARGKGGTVWDEAGLQYVDWGMGINNVLIGHAAEEIDEAVIRAIRNGQNFSRPSPLEEEAAEAVLRMFPQADMIKFCKNGSDANNAAIRLARAVTKRQHIAFDGTAPFFSTADWFCSHQAKWAGTLDADRGFALPFIFNDLDSLLRVFQARPLACVILELARAEAPTADFLKTLQALCAAHGTLLVIDEVVTGYRYAHRGLATDYWITPDLFTLGKGMGNGHAVSALLGKREYMARGAKDVFLLSTTHGAEQSGLAAAIAVTQFYQAHDVITWLGRQGRELRRAVHAAAYEYGLDGPNGLQVKTDFDCRPMLQVPAGYQREFHAALVDAGVLWPMFWCCPCYQRTDAEMQQTRAAIRYACERIANSRLKVATA
jgi:glutamate-1-semialdehyde 2,1-aminomutase